MEEWRKQTNECLRSPNKANLPTHVREIQVTIGHRTKRIGWWRVEKLVKSLVYKELCVVWWLRLHKTKRLHWFNFGLHRGAFRLHEVGEKFTYIGLHVYACGLFCCSAWKPLIHGRFEHTGALYAPLFERLGNGIRTTLIWGLMGRIKSG